jgi:hypothetical protein
MDASEVREVEGDTTEGSREDEVTDEAVDILHEEVMEDDREMEDNGEEKIEEEPKVDLDAEATRRNRILNEILTTEQSYVHSLNLIVKVPFYVHFLHTLHILLH